MVFTCFSSSFVSSINNLQFPPSGSSFTPKMNRHEGPILEWRIENIPRSFKEQYGWSAGRRCQSDSQVTTRGEPKRDAALNVFQITNFVRCTRTRICVNKHFEFLAESIKNESFASVGGCLANVLRWDIGPLFRRSDHWGCIHQTISKLMTHYIQKQK